MGKGTTFVIGAAIGAAAALLFTPNTGARNREVVAEKFDYYTNHGSEAFQNAAGTVRDKVRGVEPNISESADDIKAKINEARDRIAEQVTRNRAAQNVEAEVTDVSEGAAAPASEEPAE